VATVMGFGAGHVWRTANAGQSWVDISGNLPDAPADSVLVDSTDPAHIFAGTDVGIFETRNTGVTWTEAGVGLPNIPATRLLLFDGPGTRRLRASTYGRGIWELSLPAVPFFSLQVAPGASSSASVAAGQPATYNLALGAINGFSGTVSLNCAAAPAGETCLITPAAAFLSNTSAIVPVTVTVSTSAHAAALNGWPVVFATLLAGVLVSARKSKAMMMTMLAFFLVAGITACGGGGAGTASKKLQPDLPSQSASTVIVTATSGSVTRSMSLSLTVQ